MDARFSRFVPLGRVRAELFGEATDAAGNLLAALPSPFPPTGAYQQRQFQLGAKVSF